jgi:LysM repeat protein
MKYLIRLILCTTVTFILFPLMANPSTYTVETGDTLYSIARQYEVTVDTLREANQLDSDASIYVGQNIIIPTDSSTLNTNTVDGKTSSTKDTIYVVKKGDTLFSISMKYKTTVDALSTINNLKSTTSIYVGQKLIISSVPETKSTLNTNSDKTPTIVSYKVQKGDTLYSIAHDNNTTVAELRKMNNLTTASVIKIGQALVVTKSSENVKEIDDPRTYERKKGDTTLIWPVEAKEVAYVSGKISGVVITGSVKNESVMAIREGIVMYSGNYRGYGDVVFLKSSGNYIYMYSGLASLSVKKGQHVGYREEIGKSGTDTYSGNPVVNLMIYKNDNPVDPAKAPRG